jgi:hypothetical protein
MEPIVYRIKPVVELYEVVKYLDPRLLQIQFYKNEGVFSCNSSLYDEGHDISGNLIYNIIKKNGKSLYLLLCQSRFGNPEYYLAFIETETLQCSSVYAGKNMESAVSLYLEEVTTYGI